MKFKEPDAGIQEGDMTPMIDMTFQLIAFFMVLINFSQADQDQRVKLPKSELAKPPDQPLDDALTVNLGLEGASRNPVIYMAGQRYDFGSLKTQLDRERDLVVRNGKDPTKVTVIIRAHKDCRTGDVQTVIKSCQEARFESFALRAEEKQGR